MSVSIPNLQHIKDTLGPRVSQAFQYIQSVLNTHETQGNLNASGEPPVPPPPDALTVTNGPSGEFQIAIAHNAEFNRGINYHVHWDTSPSFTNPHPMDLGASRNDSSLNLPGQTVFFRAATSYASGGKSTWVYHGSGGSPIPVTGGVIGPRAPSMGSGTGAPGADGGPGPIQQRNSSSGYNWRAQQRGYSPGFGSAQGTPAGIGAFAGSAGGGGGGSPILPAALYDTYANWTAVKYPPAQYPLNTTFTITDWNFVTYIVRSVAGSNKWVYEFGTYEAAYASKPTNGFNGVALGANDSDLKFYDNATYIRTWEWGGAAWKYASGELPGGDTSPAVIMLAGTTVPPGYATCDGTAKTITKADATTVSFTTPPFTTGNFPKGGSYTGATITAVEPTISGHTEVASGIFAVQSTASGNAVIGNDSGAGTNVLAGAVTVASHPHSHIDTGHTHLYQAADTGHQHNLTSANAPITQPSADPVPAVLMMFAVKL